MKIFFNYYWLFWGILALPSIVMIGAALGSGDLHGQLHPTGEFAARFLVLAMMLTPLKMMFPKSRLIQWFMRRRRYLGVAVFCYGALHTLFYVIDLGSVDKMAADLIKLGIWTGWIAILIFVPLALTSNDLSVRALGGKWKRLQQLVYFAALFTALHWVFVEQELGDALVLFLPLALLEIYRLWKNWGSFLKKENI